MLRRIRQFSRQLQEILIKNGVNVTYGDSPAIGKTLKAAKKAGLTQAADEIDIKLADFKTGIDVVYDEGIQKRKFTIAKAVFDNDAVISLPKLKTHGLEKFTGAIKNQFGCIPGALKGEFHLKLPGADNCIRCFCFQEICPESAIQLKTPFLRKIINAI